MSVKINSLNPLATEIKHWGQALGFQQVGITDTDVAADEAHLLAWLAAGFHGEMDYMAKHGTRRSRPFELVPGTVRVIAVRMDYFPANTVSPQRILNNPELAYISRYALGRDYHKVLRQRLQRLARKITDYVISASIPSFQYRVFTDSAPVLEKALAQKAGLGWIGKHSNLLHHKTGSWFFLGEIYTDLPLPIDKPATHHCGSCTACMMACPTQAIVAPYRVDARRCIAYHTIELMGAIPIEFRSLMGNRIYGCDDCQLVCPWNRFATPTREMDFLPRHGFDAARLIDLFAWDEATFLHKTEGSAIRRIGYVRWLRNIAVALGNTPNTPYLAAAQKALQTRIHHESELVREHVIWALNELQKTS